MGMNVNGKFYVHGKPVAFAAKKYPLNLFCRFLSNWWKPWSEISRLLHIHTQTQLPKVIQLFLTKKQLLNFFLHLRRQFLRLRAAECVQNERVTMFGAQKKTSFKSYTGRRRDANACCRNDALTACWQRLLHNDVTVVHATATLNVSKRKTRFNKKFQLMLTRRAKAYSSSCSQTVSLSPTISSTVRCSRRSQKLIKTPLF